MKRRRAERLVVAAALALLASACSTASSQSETLTVFGTWRGEQADAFRGVLDRFERDTGIPVRYTGSGTFITAVQERVEEGDSPDVAIFPQPGLLEDLADEGYVLPLADDVSALAAQNLLPAVAEILSSTRKLDGVPFRLNVKSLVWYRPDVFAANGFAVPATWSELESLVATMAVNGYSPWCLGIAASDATGWPATDWVEDIVLRTAGTDVYDGWVAGDVAFTDDAIGSAIATFDELVLSYAESGQGRRSIINTSPARAQDPMFEEPPGCMMYRQASFQSDNLPSGTEIGPDADVDLFVLPGETAGNAPLVVGGDVAAAMTDRPETWALLRYLASPQSGEAWAEAGGYISPHAGFDSAHYSNAFDRRMDGLLDAAGVVRFDGSDRMYAPVGTNSFFDAMTLFVASGDVELAQETAQAGYDD
jgi:alpha-glucoside transport system substrate-binding protein